MFRIIATITITLLAVLTMVFAVLNADPVELNYYFGKTSVALSLALVLALVAGALLGVLASVGVVLRLKKDNVKLRREVRVAEKEIANLRKLPLKGMN